MFELKVVRICDEYVYVPERRNHSLHGYTRCPSQRRVGMNSPPFQNGSYKSPIQRRLSCLTCQRTQKPNETRSNAHVNVHIGVDEQSLKYVNGSVEIGL
jgi:hypothetical protein